NGRVVRSIAFSEIQPGNHVSSLRERNGWLEVSTTPDGEDPQLSVTLTPPAELRGTFFERRDGLVARVPGVFAVVAALLFALDRAPRIRGVAASAMHFLTARPGLAVTSVAAFAVIASAYPILFLGKSHVSPNFGTPLLYNGFPTLPGSTNDEIVNPMGADVGAMMWAHLPYSVVERRALARGELPLWNRYNSLGSPLLGQGQSMFGDPLHLWVVLCNGAAWAWDVKFLIAKWLFATGLGLAVLTVLRPEAERTSPSTPARHIGPAIVIPALVVSAAAPFIGFFIFRINHAAYFSLCYAPWSLYCWLRVTQTGTRRGAAGWIAGLMLANLALMNSGTVKEASVLLLAMNLSGAGVLLASAAPWRRRVIKLAAIAWAGVIFLLITAPVWATFLHTLSNAATNYDVPTAYQIQPSLLLGAFDEAFYRMIPLAECIFNPSANFLLLLGVLYLVATLRVPFATRSPVALGAGAMVSMALAFGLVPPAWIASVPLLGNVHHIDNCFSCVLIVLWSVLAGVGFARAAQRLGTPEGRGDLMVAAMLLFALLFGWIAFRQAAHRGYTGPGGTLSVVGPGEVRAVSGFVWGYLATLLAASAILAVVMRRALLRRSLSAAGGITVALCALLLLWRHGLHAESVDFETHVVRPPARTDLHARSPAMEFVRGAQESEPGRGYGLHDNFFMGWTGVYGLEAINSPDALVNPRVRELIVLSGTTRGFTWDFTVPPENIRAVQPVFDAFNVRFYFDRGHDQAPLRRSLRLVQTLDLDIWESPTVWPRAFFTDRVHVYDTAADLIRKIKSGDGRPFAALERSDLAELPAVPDLKGNLAERRVSAATNYQLTENTTAFSVRASAPGVIVLSEAFWPGDFRAEVNGKKAPVLRLNHAFKGVAVGAPGDYRVVFRYVPRNFSRNLMLCAGGAILLALSLVLVLRPARST
ncbi:MAG: hypothetical protein ACREH8_04235, partial [Opitutaceae bacterium]